MNPMHKIGHKGWKQGQIIKMDTNSSQVKVSYYFKQSHHSYWIHLENEQEAAMFNSKYDPLKSDISGLFNEYTDKPSLKRLSSLDAILKRSQR